MRRCPRGHIIHWPTEDLGYCNGCPESAWRLLGPSLVECYGIGVRVRPLLRQLYELQRLFTAAVIAHGGELYIDDYLLGPRPAGTLTAERMIDRPSTRYTFERAEGTPDGTTAAPALPGDGADDVSRPPVDPQAAGRDVAKSQRARPARRRGHEG